MADVCVDLSTFLSTSRHRGYGTYALELARAMGRVSGGYPDLRLSVLMGPGPALRVLPLEEGLASLPAALEDRWVLPDTLFYALRNTAGRAALRRSGARLYHSLEPKGTPWFAAPRTVVTCHDLVPVTMGYPFSPRVLPRGTRALVEWVRYRAADHVIAISRSTRQDLLAITGLADERVTVVHHGVNGELFSAVAAAGEGAQIAAYLGTDRPYFFYVGGYDQRRQVPLLVEAFCRCAPRVDAVLVLGGVVPPATAAALAEQARGQGAAERVLLPGFVPPELLAPLYRGAVAHVMLSRSEGFGMTVLEAFACGCPVVACRASCVPEVSGDAALLVDAGDAEAAAEAMALLANDPQARAARVRLGHERAGLFTWDRCAERTLEVYRRVLAASA